ncbi:MAG: Rap1a/Tai family immunity protein [Acidobacteriota bacterium]
MRTFIMGIIVFSFLLSSQQSMAGFSGMDLKKRADALERVTTGKFTDSDAGDANFFIGYVYGVAQAYNGSLICIPEVTQAGHVVSIVTKFLKDNPEKWNKAANYIVLEALSLTFQCNKK